MNIVINGKNEIVNGDISIQDILSLKKVENPDTVSVQLNGKFIKKESYSKILYDNDEIDFLYYMGGG
jgi:thiamine biosynthesis protein ThiS